MSKAMDDRRKRQSRFIRPPKQKLKKLVLQPRDLEIIKTVYDYRFLRTDHLTALIPGDRTSIEKRLRRLWEHRFIERSYQAIIPGQGMSTGKAIYSLDTRGAGLLAEENNIDPKHLKYVIRHNKPHHVFLEHQLKISQFRCVLTLALRETGLAKILFWRQDKEIQDQVTNIDSKGNERIWPVVPDGYFCLEDEGGKMCWFLEMDRYTMDHRRWLNKMKAYYFWFRKRGHTEKLGIKNFRVLAVCPTKKRMEARLEVTMRVKSQEKNGRKEMVGSKLFWFMSEESYSFKYINRILDDICFVAKDKDNRDHKILE